RSAVFKIFKESGHGHASTAENPGAADPFRVPLDRRAGGPINHGPNRITASARGLTRLQVYVISVGTETRIVEGRSRARAVLALLPAARAPQFLALIGAQVPPEVEHPVQNLVGLEVGLAAVEVHESSRNEAPLFVEDEPDAPAPARDRLAAAAALRLRARRALGAVDPREAPVRKARARRALKALPVAHVRWRFHESLKQRLRPLVRRAVWMEPHCHL